MVFSGGKKLAHSLCRIPVEKGAFPGRRYALQKYAFGAFNEHDPSCGLGDPAALRIQERSTA